MPLLIFIIIIILLSTDLQASYQESCVEFDMDAEIATKFGRDVALELTLHTAEKDKGLHDDTLIIIKQPHAEEEEISGYAIPQGPKYNKFSISLVCYNPIKPGSTKETPLYLTQTQTFPLPIKTLHLVQVALFKKGRKIDIELTWKISLPPTYNTAAQDWTSSEQFYCLGYDYDLSCRFKF
jgi:hypothetical protein